MTHAIKWHKTKKRIKKPLRYTKPKAPSLPQHNWSWKSKLFSTQADVLQEEWIRQMVFKEADLEIRPGLPWPRGAGVMICGSSWDGDTYDLRLPCVCEQITVADRRPDWWDKVWSACITLVNSTLILHMHALIFFTLFSRLSAMLEIMYVEIIKHSLISVPIKMPWVWGLKILYVCIVFELWGTMRTWKALNLTWNQSSDLNEFLFDWDWFQNAESLFFF